MSKKEEELDETICQQMSGLVELLTTSGKPFLNPEIMKKFKKLCRTSDKYVEHAFSLLMARMTTDHSEIRLSTFQMIDELFNRSHAFRECLLADFQTFLELAAGINKACPLPPPKLAADTMKNQAHKSIQQWQEKYGEAYKKLALGYNYLKTCKKVDFDSIQARVELERRQKEDTERKLEESRKIKIEKVLTELNDSSTDIELCVTEIENSIQLLMPHPEDFFIPTADPTQSSGDSDLNTVGPTQSSGDSDLNTVENKSSIHQHNEVDSQENKLGSNSCDSKFTTSSSENFEIRTSQETCNPSSSDIPSTSSQESVSASKSVSKVTESGETSEGESAKVVTLGESDQSQEQNQTNGSKTEETGKDSSIEYNDSDDSDEDDFEPVDDSTNGLRHQLGLYDRKFAITVEMDNAASKIQETEDNKEVIQGLKDQYRLVKNKFMPAVKRWLQVLTKNNAKQDTIKEAQDLKSKLEDAARKCIELEIVATSRRGGSDSDSDDEFEEVQEKEGYEADVPEHVRLEEARSAAAAASAALKKVRGRRGRKKKSPGNSSLSYWNLAECVQKEDERDVTTGKSTVRKLKPSTSASSTVTSAMVKQEPGSSGVIKREPVPSSSSSTSAGNKADKGSLLDRAPVVSFGLDLEHWEDPSNIKAPARVKHEDLGRVWIGNSATDEDATPSAMEVEALTSRSFTYTGKFEPVKWKCRAPQDNGKLCERMDRVKCPFHGKIIARDDEGRPSDPAGALADLNKTAVQELVGDVADPDLLADIEAQAGVLKEKGKGKGKGKQKAEKRKHPNLTDIKQKSTCRSRLESKIFKKTTMKKVNAALDAVAAKRLADKFGNQFNYSLH